MIKWVLIGGAILAVIWLVRNGRRERVQRDEAGRSALQDGSIPGEVVSRKPAKAAEDSPDGGSDGGGDGGGGD